jgi:hypothetical protein
MRQYAVLVPERTLDGQWAQVVYGGIPDDSLESFEKAKEVLRLHRVSYDTNKLQGICPPAYNGVEVFPFIVLVERVHYDE